MDYHHHGGYTIYCREQLAKCVIDGRLSLRAAGAECRLSRQAAGKWVRRYREEGLAGLRDRSSRPRRCPRQSFGGSDRAGGIAAPAALDRRSHRAGTQAGVGDGEPHPARRLKLNRVRDLEPQLPAQPLRTCRSGRPGALRHQAPGQDPASHRTGVTGDRRDGVKGIGAEFLPTSPSTTTRASPSRPCIRTTERTDRPPHFLYSATAWFARLGIATRGLLTDKRRKCYTANRFQQGCQQLGIRHRRTRPYTPRTNGKAERFIQTALRGNGPMPVPTRTRSNEPRPCYPSTTSTTGIDRTLESTSKHPSADSYSKTTTS